MTSPTLLPGNRFRLYRGDGASPEGFTFLCIVQTRGFTKTNQYEDATVADCDSPTTIPNRKSVVRSHEWSLTLSGIVDASRFANIRLDADSETPRNYQFLVDRPLAGGGGTWTGLVYYESLSVTEDNGGLVKFSATCRGEDALVWADAAA